MEERTANQEPQLLSLPPLNSYVSNRNIKLTGKALLDCRWLATRTNIRLEDNEEVSDGRIRNYEEIESVHSNNYRNYLNI